MPSPKTIHVVWRFALCLLAAGAAGFAAEPAPVPGPGAGAAADTVKPVWSRRLELVTPKHGKKVVAYCSDHFAIYPDKPPANPAELLPVADLLEATVAACKDLKLPFDYATVRERLPVYVTDSTAMFNRLVGRAVDKDFAGIYTGDKIVMRQQALFGDGDELNRRLLVHEVTHHVLGDASMPVPVWLAEGLAEYVANAPYRNGRLDLERNSVTAYVRARYGQVKPVPVIHPKKLFDMSYQQWQRDAGMAAKGSTYYGSAYLLTCYFLRLDEEGRLKRYCAAVMEKGSARELRLALLGKSEKDLEARISDAYRQLGLAVNFRN